LFDGGEDGGEACDEGIDGLVLAGWVIAIASCVIAGSAHCNGGFEQI
jgi:hypothetical protein